MDMEVGQRCIRCGAVNPDEVCALCGPSIIELEANRNTFLLEVATISSVVSLVAALVALAFSLR